MKPGRNDPCSCGSGKKYKKCCGAANPDIPEKKSAPTQEEINQLVALFNAGLHVELESRTVSLVERYPDSGFLWKIFGVALLAQGKDALFAMQNAAKLLPRDAEAHYNLGNALKGMGHLEGAVKSYRQAIEIKPDFAEACCNMGIILSELKQFDAAVTSFRQALEIKADYPKAYCNLGNTLTDLGQFEEAAINCRKVLEIKPDYAEAHNNLGLALKSMGRYGEAMESYRRALEIKPYLAEAHFNLGNTQKDIGRHDDAVASYRKALDIRPDYTDAYSNLLLTLNYSANQPHSYYLEQAYKYGQVVANRVSVRFSSWQCAPQPERLRVGMVSGDLRNHSAGHFLEGLISNINPSRIELIAYPTQSKEDDLTARIRPCFSAWKSLVGKSDSEAAHLIHDDGVHILLDLSGHTAYNRLPVFAWKPAPVQAMWLGYFATTGVAEIDYIVGDKWLLPYGEEHHFVEKSWRLPNTGSCMTPPKEYIEVNELPALMNQSITFGSLNNLSKMNEQVVACWARILGKIPKSRLYLNTGSLRDNTVRQDVMEKYVAHGIAENRLILEATTGRNAALNSYGKIDIALDPFPYPGGTTSFEALWMGVPILTMRGSDYLSHLGESVMQNAGLPDWIAEDEEDYIAKAIAFSGNLEHLAKLRSSLRTNVLASPLFDQLRFARDFEAALWGMWQAHAQTQPGY
ncbi:MAG: tetratricopeptide repeat protein [Burkholderiales bacterium]|nr:tetratricopeptide repeat protein [Burkholderiales bacterium]